MSFSRLFMPMLLAAALSTTALAQSPAPIELTNGGAVVEGRVVGGDMASYRFTAKAGDDVSIALTAPTPSANFNVLPLGDETAIFVGAVSGPEFQGTIPADGDYEIRVYLMGQAAQTGSANFTLDIALGADADAADFADGRAGGPDFWAVAGLSVGGSLNVRSGPSASAAVVANLSNGAVLRNLGCEGAGDARWCQVEIAEGANVNGWVSGRYLVESGAPAVADATVEGTPYHATGELACTLAAFPDAITCPFGVIRVSENNLASIFITLPDGDERLIEFRDGQPVQPSGMTMTAQQNGDVTVVNLDNGAEVYSVVDIVYLGD